MSQQQQTYDFSLFVKQIGGLAIIVNDIDNIEDLMNYIDKYKKNAVEIDCTCNLTSIFNKKINKENSLDSIQELKKWVKTKIT